MKTKTDIYNDGSYLELNRGWHEEDSPYKARFCSKILQKNKVEFNTAADVGCGAGLVTELLAKRFNRASFVGYDFSEDVAGFWQKREQLSNLSYLNEAFGAESQSVDLALCLDVFEHVEDYYGFLRDLNQKADYFVFNIPLDMSVMKVIYGLAFVRKEVGHIHYFSVYSALETLRDTNYEIIDRNLSVAFLGVPPRNFRQLLVLPLRLLTLLLGKSVAAKFFGGISMVVLARRK